MQATRKPECQRAVRWSCARRNERHIDAAYLIGTDSRRMKREGLTKRKAECALALRVVGLLISKQSARTQLLVRDRRVATRPQLPKPPQ